ncbi:MAG: nucleoside 2-deoxyribosyltransferase [Acidobacteria bacterium]|nr:nucleoside 2-deoxyribosyltransferase [Acidobacteriota bacterium]
MSYRHRVVYVGGPFRAPDHWGIAVNVRAAETLALEVWRLGATALCPHLNSAHFQDTLPDRVWLEGDLELLSRCDALLLVSDWEASQGTQTERQFALNRGIPVFASLIDLAAWLGR